MDGRRKLSDADYAEVKRVYNELHSYQKTADHFNVSKRLVIFIVNPEIYARFRLRNKQNQHWREYYDTDKRREYMRKYRAKKRKAGFMINTDGTPAPRIAERGLTVEKKQKGGDCL